MTNYEKQLLKRHTMTDKVAMTEAKLRGWDVWKLASKDGWIVSKFDEKTQTQIRHESNGFSMRKFAVMHAIERDFDPSFG